MPSSSSSTSPKATTTPHALFLPFDPNSPLLVAKGVLTTGTVGAITGASIGVIQSKNPFALSINMTINLSIAGLTFFSIREYLVSPLLLSIELTPSHSRRLSLLQHGEGGLSEVQRGKLPSLSEVRWDRVSDSAIAGGLTGGVLSAAFRGRATFVKAGITSSLIASILQLSINQARVIRLKTLAKRQSTSTITSPPSPQKTLEGSFNDQNQSQSQITQSFEQPLKNPIPNTDIKLESQKHESNVTFPERMMNSLTKFLPVRKLTNEEYVQTLEKKRMEVDKMLREIDEEEKRMYDWAQSQNGTRS
ncbi:uncharacterized protein L199_004041 [Kwoniella botswanensis]|uniref:uncharacterized protein n=1 Tax=Kwoniella botswanensis TaxID=1268659 RepID=UPI00315D794A